MRKKLSMKWREIYQVGVILVFIASPLEAIASNLTSSDADYSFAISSDWQDCQQVGSDYQAVYAFETPSFYVNICQKEDAFFYLGEAKQGEEYLNGIGNLRSSIFIPAYPLENSNGFRAENGNVSYWIILPFTQQNSLNADVSKPAEAVLTIKRNNRLISIESSLNKYCHQPNSAIVWETIELQPRHSHHLATIPQNQDVGLEFSGIPRSDRPISEEVFSSNSNFDFYRIGGELHRLTTCK